MEREGVEDGISDEHSTERCKGESSLTCQSRWPGQSSPARSSTPTPSSSRWRRRAGHVRRNAAPHGTLSPGPRSSWDLHAPAPTAWSPRGPSACVQFAVARARLDRSSPTHPCSTTCCCAAWPRACYCVPRPCASGSSCWCCSVSRRLWLLCTA